MDLDFKSLVSWNILCLLFYSKEFRLVFPSVLGIFLLEDLKSRGFRSKGTSDDWTKILQKLWHIECKEGRWQSIFWVIFIFLVCIYIYIELNIAPKVSEPWYIGTRYTNRWKFYVNLFIEKHCPLDVETFFYKINQIYVLPGLWMINFFCIYA